MVKSIRWLEQWCLQVAAELQQRWRRTNRWRKSIPRSSSSHREGSITQSGASCGRYNQHRCWSTPKTPTWTYVGSQVEGPTRYDVAVWLMQWYSRTHNRNWILIGTFGQCSSRSSGVMCSDFLAENMRRATALKTDCSHCNSCPEIHERTELQ